MDLDGCIIDSRDTIARAIAAVLYSNGIASADHMEIEAAIGPPISVAFETILQARGLDRSLVPRYVAEFRAAYGPISVGTTHLFPKMREALKTLAARTRLAIVTSKAQQLATPIAENLQLFEYVDRIFAPDAAQVDEPKTITLGRAIAHYQSVGGVMVGDRFHDIEAGKAHALSTLGVTWGNGSYQELLEAGASSIVTAPDDLAAAVFQLL